MKPFILPLGLAWLVLTLAACGHLGTDSSKAPDAAVSQTPPAIAVSPPSPAQPSANRQAVPAPLPSPTAAASEKEDNSIRAIGTQATGQLLVKPASKATVAPMGAPSCLGQETDLHWRGDYEAVWESKTAQAPVKVMTFPAEFEIIQRSDSPVEMRHFTLDHTDMFAYTPRYTDCHALETYLFGVSDGTAFPIPFELKPGTTAPYIIENPHRPFQIKDGTMIVTGGQGAGQDYINVYRFKYDAVKKTMILENTDLVRPGSGSVRKDASSE
jgi:hypothetical protein